MSPRRATTKQPVVKYLPQSERMELLRSFRGHYVELAIESILGEDTYYGTVIAAGALMSGTSRDFIVLRGKPDSDGHPGPDFAWSGAVVRHITTLERP